MRIVTKDNSDLSKPTPKQKKQPKSIRQTGKVAKEWEKTKREWFKLHPAEFYICYLCGMIKPKSEITLDHVLPRSARPDLRNNLDNLKPACWTCNSIKGSKHEKTP